MEFCTLCDAPAERHPIVGIGRADLVKNAGEMVPWAVCRACHVDPAHRKWAFKLHFFERDAAAVATAGARLTDAISRRGDDIVLGG